MRHALLAILCSLIGLTAFQFSIPAFAQEKKIILTDFAMSPLKMNAGKLPKGWVLKVWRGRPDIRLIQDEDKGVKVLRMRSDKASFSIHRAVKLDLKEFPHLSWKWKVTKLPEGADARNSKYDDQAAGIYVVFHKFPGFLNSQLIGYVWETSAPAGAILKSRKNSKVHYIVVRSGVGDLDKWITEKRNVLDDYRRVFGSEPPQIGGIALMIDTDDTLSNAESYFARVEFKGRASKALIAPEYAHLAQAGASPAWVYE